eukprot:6033617-Amphidinium_carterae.1
MDTQSDLKLQMEPLGTTHTGDGLPAPENDYSPDSGPGEPVPETEAGLAAEGPGELVPSPTQAFQEPGPNTSHDTGPGDEAQEGEADFSDEGSGEPVPQLREPLALEPLAERPPVPEVGAETAVLGEPAGEALRRRRVAERRWIFAQRNTSGPDDSPFQHHTFDPS